VVRSEWRGIAPRPARTGPGARGLGDGGEWGGGRDGGERIVGGVHLRRGQREAAASRRGRAGDVGGLRSSAALTSGPREERGEETRGGIDLILLGLNLSWKGEKKESDHA
jgi:hypothetical protein